MQDAKDLHNVQNMKKYVILWTSDSNKLGFIAGCTCFIMQ